MGLDYYAILNIPRDSNFHEISLSYRKYAILSHPNRQQYPMHPEDDISSLAIIETIDHLPKLSIEQFWRYVNEAYDVLANPLYRHIYDIFGEEGLKSGTPTPNGYVQPYIYHGFYMKTYIDVFGSDSPYVDLIDAVQFPPPLYNIRTVRKGVRTCELPMEIPLELDLKEIFYGGIKKVCVTCKDLIRPDDSCTDIDELDYEQTKEIDRMLTIPFHCGIRTGCRIQFTQQGEQCPRKFPIDIIFIVTDKQTTTTNSTSFTRFNNVHLKMIYKVNLFTSLCGIVVELNTIDGRRLLIPITDSISPNYVKIVEDEGLPYENNPMKKGNLYIYFDVEFPQNLPSKCRPKLNDVLKCSFDSPCKRTTFQK